MSVRPIHPIRHEAAQPQPHLPMLLAPYPKEDFRVLIRRTDGFYEAVQASANATVVYIETFRDGEKLSGTIGLTIDQVAQVHAALGDFLRKMFLP